MKSKIVNEAVRAQAHGFCSSRDTNPKWLAMPPAVYEDRQLVDNRGSENLSKEDQSNILSTNAITERDRLKMERSYTPVKSKSSAGGLHC